MDTQSITESTQNLTDEQIADSLEERARHIGQAIRALMTDMNTYEDHVRPSVVTDIATELPDLLNAMDVAFGLDESVPESFARFHNMTGFVFGQVLLQIVGPWSEGDINKRFWLNVAEVLGPDHAQTMYRAAVFMTKVA